MTTNHSDRRTSTGGDGTNLIFSYGFKVIEQTQLGVYEVSATNVATLKVLATHYTVSGVGQANGGNVTFVAGQAPAAGTTVVIHGETPVSQTYDPTATQVYNASALMAILDKLAQTIQENRRDLDYCLKYRVGSANYNKTNEGGVPDPSVAGKQLEASVIANPPTYIWG